MRQPGERGPIVAFYQPQARKLSNWLLECAGNEAYPVLFGGNYRGPDFTEYAGTHFLVKREGSKYKYTERP
jgi:hypothetical protein